MNTYTENELLDKEYTKISDTIYSKSISLEELTDIIKNYYSFDGNVSEKRHKRLEYVKSLDVYKLYDNRYYHISNFRMSRRIRNNKTKYFFDGSPSKIIDMNSKILERKISENNRKILRMYHSGDPSKELYFNGLSMERKKVLLLNQEEFVSDFEVHHIALINNQSRDKQNMDPNKWLKCTDMTSFNKKEIKSIDFDNSLINNEPTNFNYVVVEINQNERIAYYKSESATSRIKELMCCMIIPKSDHGIFHNLIGSRKDKNIGINDYNPSFLPFALKDKQNYDSFIKFVCDEYKFNKGIFSSYEDHISFLEV